MALQLAREQAITLLRTAEVLVYFFCEESAHVNEMTHVIVTDSRDSVGTICTPSLLDCNQDPKGSLDEQDLSITLPGPPPAGEGSPRATPMIHVDVPDARDSPGSASTLNFCDPVRQQEVSLDEQDQPVALPGPSPKDSDLLFLQKDMHENVEERDMIDDSAASDVFILAHEFISEDETLALREDLPENVDDLGTDADISVSDVFFLAPEFISENELWIPLGRLDKYAASKDIFQREMAARILLDTLSAVSTNESACISVLERISSLAEDPEPIVRAELMEQVPHIALFFQENWPSLSYAFSNFLLPIMTRYLTDENHEVWKISQESLLALLKQKLIDPFDFETQVFPVLLELTAPDRAEYIKARTLATMCKMSPMVGKDITECLILPRFCDMCYDWRKLHVRKICADYFSDICSVVGQQVTEEMLIPCFIQLCSDKVWRIRKACVECFVNVSCATSLEIRWSKLSALFINLISDLSWSVCQTAFKSLGPFISTFANPSCSGHHFKAEIKSSQDMLEDKNRIRDQEVSEEVRRAEVQDVVPQALLDQYLTMTDPYFIETIDTKIVQHCAYSFPGVAMTLGQKYWHCLKELYESLASDEDWEVRRTLAFSIHELALILGEQLTAADLVPIFNGFLKDIDQVRLGVLLHLHDFLESLPTDKRREYLYRLQEFLVTDNNINWRIRNELSQQLILLLELYSPRDVYDYLRPIAMNLCTDKVSSVRWVSYKLVSKMLKKLHMETPETFGVSLINELVEDFCKCTKWSGRQSFVYICDIIIENDCLPMDSFAIHLMPQLLTLVNDSVPNVRMALAKTLTQTLLEKECFLASTRYQDAVELTVMILQLDQDHNVKYFASKHPASTKIAEDAMSVPSLTY